MATTTRLEVQNGETLGSIRSFLTRVLEDSEVAALFVPMRLGGSIMPSLVTDARQLDRADPLAPSFPLNAARHVGKLTRGELDGYLVAVMRPCEIRAFRELVKLNQGSTDNLVVIALDCHGAYTNRDFQAYLQGKAEEGLSTLGQEFLQRMHDSKQSNGGVPELAKACKACEHPAPEGADILIGLFGQDIAAELPVIAQTPAGEGLLSRLGMEDSSMPAALAAREEALGKLLEERISYRDAMFAETQEQTATPTLLAQYLEDCVNCYNCRVACPVCYCKECVFATDVFDHEPWQYLGWAKRKGALRMPVDTMFYHLTRLAHSSTACVGCGQCSNACPNDIPVMELFRLVASKTQKAFDYEAGRSVEELPPLTVFQREEFAEVTGGVI